MADSDSQRILVIGSGGREAAFCWHLNRLGRKVFAAPGSAAIAEYAQLLQFGDYNGLARLITENQISLVIVGPEKYLADGVVDFLEARGINVFGPSQKASQLECDKAWAKDFCIRNSIPTALSKTLREVSEIRDALRDFKPPYVVKAAGLAAGKGVWIGADPLEAEKFATECLEHHSSVILEEFITGEEISYFALVSGEDVTLLGAAQDHKRLLENDLGPNTGGMGSYSPVPLLTTSLDEKIQTQILRPVVAALKSERVFYRGFLFIGLMISRGEPFVLEFNCRMGDPETQSLLLRLKTPLDEMIHSLMAGSPLPQAEMHPGVALAVVAAAKGYPDHPQSGFALPGIEMVPSDLTVFHSGTDKGSSGWIAKGGRLFSVATLQPSLFAAQNLVYPWLESLSFLNEIHFRKDVGVKAYRHLTPSRKGDSSSHGTHPTL